MYLSYNPLRAHAIANRFWLLAAGLSGFASCQQLVASRISKLYKKGIPYLECLS